MEMVDELGFFLFFLLPGNSQSQGMWGWRGARCTKPDRNETPSFSLCQGGPGRGRWGFAPQLGLRSGLWPAARHGAGARLSQAEPRCLKLRSAFGNCLRSPPFLPPHKGRCRSLRRDLALVLTCAPAIIFFSGCWDSYFLMTMQSVFGWEIPRGKACCYLRKIMKSILNERTGENPSTKLH